MLRSGCLQPTYQGIKARLPRPNHWTRKMQGNGARVRTHRERIGRGSRERPASSSTIVRPAARPVTLACVRSGNASEAEMDVLLVVPIWRMRSSRAAARDQHCSLWRSLLMRSGFGATARARGVQFMSDQLSPDILGLTAQIVSAHVSKNRVDADGLTSLIQSVYRSLSAAGSAAQPSRSARASAGGAGEEVGVPGLHRLPRGREEAEDAEAASADQLRPEPGRVSRQVGPAARAIRWWRPATRPRARRWPRASGWDASRRPAPEPEVAKLPARRARGAKG